MKESVLDVLMYLVEHYFDEDRDIASDQESLRHELAQAGFREHAIRKAFSWLEGLASDSGAGAAYGADAPGRSTRIFTSEEAERLSAAGTGFLYFLEQTGVLDAETRERVIDQVLALETDGIDLEQLKWVVLMVLFNQPGKEAVFTWMEDFVAHKVSGRLH